MTHAPEHFETLVNEDDVLRRMLATPPTKHKQIKPPKPEGERKGD